MTGEIKTTSAAPRRILYVVPFSDIGGSEQVVLDHLRCLDRHQYEPILVSLRPGDIVEAARNLGVTVYALRPHKSRELFRVAQAIAQLSLIIKRERIDLIFASQGTMLLYCGLAAAPLHRPVVWTVHDPLRGSGAFERTFVLVQRLIKPAWVISSSQGTLQSYLSAYPNIGNRHTVISPGTDSKLLEAGADAADARRTLRISVDAPILSVFARLQSSKGHLYLLEAVPKVLQRFPKATFVMVGDTQFGIEPGYKTQIIEAIRRLGVEASVQMTGYISEAKKKDLLAASTAVVHPATWEPFGIAVIEGMAVGKPIVAAASSGPSEIVVDAETGYLAPCADSAALAEAIVRILENPENAVAMGEAGRKRVQERYDVRSKVREAEILFDTILAKTPPNGKSLT